MMFYYLNDQFQGQSVKVGTGFWGLVFYTVCNN